MRILDQAISNRSIPTICHGISGRSWPFMHFLWFLALYVQQISHISTFCAISGFIFARDIGLFYSLVTLMDLFSLLILASSSSYMITFCILKSMSRPVEISSIILVSLMRFHTVRALKAVLGRDLSNIAFSPSKLPLLYKTEDIFPASPNAVILL